jgi:hypothetical protein
MCNGRHSRCSQASYSIIAYASPLKSSQDAMNSHGMSSAARFAFGRPRAGSKLCLLQGFSCSAATIETPLMVRRARPTPAQEPYL